MINKLSYLLSTKKNPYYNLALEEVLAKNIGKNEGILYLWKNSNTVVVGKHQNAYLECNLSLMEKNHIFLARRKTGGGAVFHDDNNLNFTFISKKEDYDLGRNQRIIKEAIKSFGLNAEISGRNDITINGKKFSGNAFFVGKDYAIHHGTIMLDVDKTKLATYLNVKKSKLINKGVSSVKSRVVNLKELNPDITLKKIENALQIAFEKEYNLNSNVIDIEKLCEFEDKINEYSSKEWLYGKFPKILSENKKDYGEIIIAEIDGKLTVFSDILDVKLLDEIKQTLQKEKNFIELRNGFSPLQKEIINDTNEMLLEVTNKWKR